MLSSPLCGAGHRLRCEHLELLLRNFGPPSPMTQGLALRIYSFWSLVTAFWSFFTDSYSLSLISTLILSHQCLDFPVDRFCWGFPAKLLYAFVISAMRAIFPAHIISIDSVTLTLLIEEIEIWNFYTIFSFFSLSRSRLQYSRQHVVPNTRNPSSSLRGRDNDSHPQSTKSTSSPWEPNGRSVKGREFPDQLSYYQLLEKDFEWGL